jgi:hypothetical protein
MSTECSEYYPDITRTAIHSDRASKALIVFSCSNAEVAVSNLTGGADVCASIVLTYVEAEEMQQLFLHPKDLLIVYRIGKLK